MLNTWDKKSERNIYWPVTEKGVWKIRTNHDLRYSHKVTDLIEEFGYVVRLDQTREAMNILSKTQDKRKVKTPSLRWLEDVENDLWGLNTKSYKRESFVSVVEEVEFLIRHKSQGVSK
jgi:hypothetical protein